jgi:flagellar biosynthetic protein FlhB
MAGDDGEKTELATPRRLEDLASKGQFPYSRELAGALLLFLIAAALKASGGGLVASLGALFRAFFTLDARPDVTIAAVPGLFWRVTTTVFGIVGPLLLLALAVATAAGYLQVGVSMNTERMRWRWERLNPVAGLKRLFSVRSVLPLVLSLAKLAAVGFIAWATIGSIMARAPELMLVDVGPLSGLISDGALTMAFRVGVFLLFIGLVDVLWQRFTFMKDSMMSKNEVKEETKQAEGDPQMKSRIKQRQREIARAKMIRDVRKAAVIIRNPTHFAVALKYERGADAAPRCLAKGRDHIALRIIAEAEKHKVPVVSKPELARELHRVVRVGHTIPEALYKAVAGVLAYVLRRNRQTRAEA